MFFFGLQDDSGTIKVKTFGKDAEKFYQVVQEGEFYTLQFAKVVPTANPTRKVKASNMSLKTLGPGRNHRGVEEFDGNTLNYYYTILCFY